MTATPQKNLFRQPEWLAAILMTAAVVWLHFYFLFHAGAFWRDEVNLINLAGRHSLADMQKDSFPVLMPFLVSIWSALGLGRNDLNLRLLGILTGIGIPVALWAAAWTARRAPPLLSLALLGLNATVIFYGDSLRAYGLGSFFIVLTVAAMWAFLKKPSWPRAGILTVAAVLSVQSLYQNAVLFAAICFGAWVACARRKNFPAAWKILAAAFVAAASLLPYWKNILGMPEAASSLRVGFLPALALMNFKSVLAFPLPLYLNIWEFLALAVICLGCANLFILGKKSSGAANEILADDLPLFAGATLIAAFAGFSGFLWFAALPTQPWYFIPPAALAAVCLELGVPLSSLPRLARVAVFSLIAATTLIGTPLAQRGLNRHFTNVDKLAQQLTAEASPQDFIVVAPWYCGISFERYFKSATPWQTLPALADHSTHRYDLFREKMKTPHAIQPMLDRMAATLQSGHCVWVVGTTAIPEPGTPAVKEPVPPPLNMSGWSDTPYSSAWQSQAAFFLAGHSLQFERVDHETNSYVNSYEDLQMLKATGWRANSLQ
jgi:hypothetical protein